MKKYIAIVLAVTLFAVFLTSCRGIMSPQDASANTSPSDNTQPSQNATEEKPAKTESANILANIWEVYEASERFSVCGGTAEKSVSNAPGDLNINNTDELTSRYLLPKEQLVFITEGASLVHLENNNIFTGAVFRLQKDADITAVARAIRNHIQNTNHVSAQPDKLIIANMGNQHLLVAFGGVDTVDTFKNKLSGVYAGATVIYDENLVV